MKMKAEKGFYEFDIPNGYKSRAGNKLGKEIRRGTQPDVALGIAKIVAEDDRDHVAFTAIEEAEEELKKLKNLTEGLRLVKSLARRLGFTSKFGSEIQMDKGKITMNNKISNELIKLAKELVAEQGRFKKITQLEEGGHTIFKDAEYPTRIAISDTSGSNPEKAEDGIMWVDEKKIAENGLGMDRRNNSVIVPLYGPENKKWSTPMNPSGAFKLLKYLGAKQVINVDWNGEQFKLIPK